MVLQRLLAATRLPTDHASASKRQLHLPPRRRVVDISDDGNQAKGKTRKMAAANPTTNGDMSAKNFGALVGRVSNAAIPDRKTNMKKYVDLWMRTT